MPELLTQDPFPRLSRLLAQRYAYLTEGFIRYRGPGPPEDFELLRLFEAERSVFAVLATRDARVPYPARFALLTGSKNRRLTGQTDLLVCKAWPQPSVNVAFRKARGDQRHLVGRTVGRDRPTEPTDVVLRHVGSAQLWWPAGDPPAGEAGEPSEANEHGPAVIWEAFLDIREEDLLEWLWDGCEAFLSERGYAPASGRAAQTSGPTGMGWMQKTL